MHKTPHSRESRVSAATADDFSGFRAVRHRRWRLLIHPEIDPAQAVALTSSYGLAGTENRPWRRVKSAPWTVVFLAGLEYQGRHRKVYVKYELPRSFIDTCKYLWRRTRSRKAMAASLMLRRQGFNAPEPWVLLEKGFGPFRTKNGLATEAVENSLAMGRKIECEAAPDTPSGLRLRRRMIREFARLVARLHNRGILHGDLGLSNVLVREAGEKMEIWLIDNERTRQYPKEPPSRLVIKNLIQINMFRNTVSDAERMRFLVVYGQQRNLAKEEIRRLAHRVRAGTERRMINRTRKGK